jgi:pSer/pThr/pTyr-binding forkhead associated (FHA) protein
LIPHDNSISAEHAEITCRWRDGRYRWHLIDLRSTNGTFLRVWRAVLLDGKSVMLGGRRFMFCGPGAGVAHRADSSQGRPARKQSTRVFENPHQGEMDQVLPRLVEVTPRGDGQTIPLDRSPLWIGRDAQQCQIVLDGDPFVSPKHARVYRDERGRWMIEDANSLNGVWMRIRRAVLDRDAAFQLGEQRFQFRFLRLLSG